MTLVTLSTTVSDYTDMIWAGLEGVGHGGAMVLNVITLHQFDSLDSYVDELVETNGGAYSFANGAAHVGVGAAAAAAALAAAPAIAAWSTTFTLPTLGYVVAADGTLMLVGGGTVTITGAEIVAVGGTVIFMTREGFEKMPGGNNQYHNSQVPRLMQEYGLKGRPIQRKIHEELQKYLPGERTVETIREIIELIVQGIL